MSDSTAGDLNNIKFIAENKIGSLPGPIVCALRIGIVCELHEASRNLSTKWV